MSVTSHRSMPPAVVAMMSYSGLGIVRSLGRRGITVYAVADRPDEIGMSSRYATPVVIPDFIESEERTIESLLKLSSKIGSEVVLFPTGDSIVLPVSDHRDQLKPHFRFLMPDRDVTTRLVTKSGLAEAIAEHGALGPMTSIVHSQDDLEESISSMILPVIIKPANSSSWYRDQIVSLIGSRKAIECSTQIELRESYELVSSVDPNVVIQEVIPGGDDRLYYVCGYFDSRCNLETAFVGRKLRITPIHYGSASFVESIRDDSLIEAAADFLSRMKYRGLFGVEFKHDPRDGEFKIIEVNVRYGLWDVLASRCGIDLAYLAYARETGLPYRVSKDYRAGVRWVSSRRDIDACTDYIRDGSLSPVEWIKSVFGETEHAVFASDDPIPGLYEAIAIVEQKLAGIRSKLLRK